MRITEIAPGLVETEFSMVRFGEDRRRADKVYEGMTPLTAEDVADCIVWAVTRPPHVNVDEIVVRPVSLREESHDAPRMVKTRHETLIPGGGPPRYVGSGPVGSGGLIRLGCL